MRCASASILGSPLRALAGFGRVYSTAATRIADGKWRQPGRDSERALGRSIVAEIPGDVDLTLFSEDAKRFFYGEQSIDKDLIVAVRVLINGAPIAGAVSKRAGARAAAPPTSFEDRPEGIARDRWDVAVETVTGPILIPCGAIRERVSQELARTVFEAVKAELVQRDAASP